MSSVEVVRQQWCVRHVRELWPGVCSGSYIVGAVTAGYQGGKQRGGGGGRANQRHQPY